jgi:HK97 gp10 family phage protein
MTLTGSIRIVFDHFPQATDAVHTITTEEVARAAYDVESIAKRLVPVLTGTLRRSIHTVFSRGGLRAVVGPSVFYAVFIEFGTRLMSARPYMRPAAAQALPRFRDRLRARLRGFR